MDGDELTSDFWVVFSGVDGTDDVTVEFDDDPGGATTKAASGKSAKNFSVKLVM